MRPILKNLLLDTYPYFIHGPGLRVNSSPLFHPMAETALAYNYGPIEPCPNLSIITWNSDQAKGILEQSLDRLHVPHLTLGRGCKRWKHTMKTELTLNALRDSNDEYVIGIDCWDAVLIRPLVNVIDTFLALQANLVFNAELFLWPDVRGTITDVWRKEQLAASSINSPFRFLNAGAWMGRREFCIEFFRRCMEADPPMIGNKYSRQTILNDDQIRAHNVFHEYTGQVKMDCRCQLFQNLAFLNKGIIQYIQPTIL